jgi:secreted trypsin-like serine protease
MKSFIILALCVLSAMAGPAARSPAGRLFGNQNFAGRIVGGEDAIPHSAPFIVTLNWTPNPEIYWAIQFCSGSLINANWIVTAAHCYFDDGFILVRAGEHNIDEFEPDVQVSQISQVIIHPLYDETIIGPHDIALFRLATPFVFNDKVQPIVLPAQDYIHSGAVRLFGWGSTSNTNTPNYPSILQTVEKVILTLAQCRAIPWINPAWIDDTNLCTGPIGVNIDACDGDSGGPLVQTQSNNSTELVGIVSWGFFPCGDGPSVKARVSAYRNWIDSYVNA